LSDGAWLKHHNQDLQSIEVIKCLDYLFSIKVLASTYAVGCVARKKMRNALSRETRDVRVSIVGKMHF
jgi:hypothetical protein